MRVVAVLLLLVGCEVAEEPEEPTFCEEFAEAACLAVECDPRLEVTFDACYPTVLAECPDREIADADLCLHQLRFDGGWCSSVLPPTCH